MTPNRILDEALGGESDSPIRFGLRDAEIRRACPRCGDLILLNNDGSLRKHRRWHISTGYGDSSYWTECYMERAHNEACRTSCKVGLRTQCGCWCHA